MLSLTDAVLPLEQPPPNASNSGASATACPRPRKLLRGADFRARSLLCATDNGAFMTVLSPCPCDAHMEVSCVCGRSKKAPRPVESAVWSSVVSPKKFVPSNEWEVRQPSHTSLD